MGHRPGRNDRFYSTGPGGEQADRRLRARALPVRVSFRLLLEPERDNQPVLAQSHLSGERGLEFNDPQMPGGRLGMSVGLQIRLLSAVYFAQWAARLELQTRSGVLHGSSRKLRLRGEPGLCRAGEHRLLLLPAMLG